MAFYGQPILPAVRKMKDLEKLIEMKYAYFVLLDSHISRVQSVVNLAKANGKKALLHADLIEGLKNDEYAAEFLCQVVQPAGIISTKSNVIMKAKQNGLLAIQRLFLLDTSALEKGCSLLQRTKPDYAEVLPGVIPSVIAEVCEKTGIPIFAGGLIRSVEDVERALSAGASAVTTSDRSLWKHFESRIE